MKTDKNSYAIEVGKSGISDIVNAVTLFLKITTLSFVRIIIRKCLFMWFQSFLSENMDYFRNFHSKNRKSEMEA